MSSTLDHPGRYVALPSVIIVLARISSSSFDSLPDLGSYILQPLCSRCYRPLPASAPLKPSLGETAKLLFMLHILFINFFFTFDSSHYPHTSILLSSLVSSGRNNLKTPGCLLFLLIACCLSFRVELMRLASG